MTQYNSLNIKLSFSQLNKLKSTKKDETKVVLRISSNMIGDNETNYLHKILLTIGKFQVFVKLLPIIHQPILTYEKLSYLR